jgi:hypothetical protein
MKNEGRRGKYSFENFILHPSSFIPHHLGRLISHIKNNTIFILLSLDTLDRKLLQILRFKRAEFYETLAENLPYYN